MKPTPAGLGTGGGVPVSASAEGVVARAAARQAWVRSSVAARGASMTVRSSSTASTPGSSSAARRSSACWNRSAGSGSRQRRITLSSPGGIVGRRCEGRGGALVQAGQGGGGRAVTAERGSGAGALEQDHTQAVDVGAAVHRLAADLLGRQVLDRAQHGARLGVSVSSRILAMPKSVTMTRSSAHSRMLAGLMSRCTSPARWAAARASATSAPTWATSRKSSIDRPSSWSRRVVPRTSSITIASSPSSWQVS